MTYTWLLFDADGTLFNFDRAEAEALAHSFADQGLPCSADTTAAYHRFNKQVWDEFEAGTITAPALRLKRFALLFHSLGLDLDLPDFSRRYTGHLGMGAYLVDGAKELICALRGRCGLAIITNGLSEVQRSRLARSELAGCFEHLFISEEMGAAKPDTAYFDAVFATLGSVPRGQVLVIGDSLNSDIRGGIAYGLDTCWYNPEGLPAPAGIAPRYEVRRLDEVLDLPGMPAREAV